MRFFISPKDHDLGKRGKKVRKKPFCGFFNFSFEKIPVYLSTEKKCSTSLIELEAHTTKSTRERFTDLGKLNFPMVVWF